MSPVTRRTALWSLAALGALTACAPTVGSAAPTTRRFGAEWEPQERTFLAWPTSDIWAEDTPDVQRDIAGLASVIAEFQPVVLLARPELVDGARRAVSAAVEVVDIPVDDLWARDTLPVFVEEDGRVRGVDLNFNGWGGKQDPHDSDAAAAAAVTRMFGLDRITTRLVGEAGALETDGLGTLLATESSLVPDRSGVALLQLSRSGANPLQLGGRAGPRGCSGMRDAGGVGRGGAS